MSVVPEIKTCLRAGFFMGSVWAGLSVRLLQLQFRQTGLTVILRGNRV